MFQVLEPAAALHHAHEDGDDLHGGDGDDANEGDAAGDPDAGYDTGGCCGDGVGNGGDDYKGSDAHGGRE